MYANELFCNPSRSYSDLFKIICDYKHQLEKTEAEKIIRSTILYNKIVETFKFSIKTNWISWGNISEYNCEISYRYINNTHVFLFKSNDKNYFIHLKNKIPKPFAENFLDELKKHANLKPLFINSVLVGEKTYYPRSFL